MVVMRLRVKEVVERYREQFPPQKRPNQGDIAYEAGIDPAILSRYVTGKIQRPDMSVISRLCTYLHITDANEIFELVEIEDEADGQEKNT